MFSPEKVINKALLLGAERADAILLEVDQVEQAFRGGIVESNEAKTRIYGVRVVVSGVMGIASSTRPDAERLVKSAIKAASIGSRARKLASGELARGRYRFPEVHPVIENFMSEISDYILAFTSEVRERLSGLIRFIEVVATGSRVKRLLVSSEGVDAFEEKPLVDFSASAIVSGRKEISSIAIGGAGGLEVVIDVNPKKLAKALIARSIAGAMARKLKPAFRGFAFPIILSGKSAAALIHEAVGHTLEADVALERGKPIKIGVKVASKELTVIDDPLTPGGYGSYFFDDEGIVAKRKTLIENGFIVDVLHNRWSAYEYGAIPKGNGRGLFFFPKALMSNIKVKPGDWRFKEIIEETKFGFLVNDVVKAELVDGMVTLIPDEAWLVEKGEVKTPVMLREIRIPLNKALNKIDAIAREVASRFTVEKGLPIGEYSPPLRISEAYVF
ncbi:MAG: TldD/PmbA family protein [archaeon GB-1867-005]|nr:TldD/PmbA family protein [Candidatus Culexmicrobium cathedralense]